MRNYLLCFMVVVILIAIFYLTKTEEKATDSKSIVDEILAMNFKEYKSKYNNHLSEADNLITYINIKGFAKDGYSEDIKSFLKPNKKS